MEPTDKQREIETQCKAAGLLVYGFTDLEIAEGVLVRAPVNAKRLESLRDTYKLTASGPQHTIVAVKT
jgi:hypothetical protein